MNTIEQSAEQLAALVLYTQRTEVSTKRAQIALLRKLTPEETTLVVKRAMQIICPTDALGMPLERVSQ